MNTLDRTRTILPNNLVPIGLSRAQAAAYIGVSASTFDKMVSDGSMPRPRRIGARTVWVIHEVTQAFMELPYDGAPDASDSSAGQASGWDD